MEKTASSNRKTDGFGSSGGGVVHSRSRSEMMELRSAPLSLKRPAVLSEEFNGADGLWHPEQYLKARWKEEGVESLGVVRRRQMEMLTAGGGSGDGFSAASVAGVLSAGDGTDIVLSPHRRSFNAGCKNRTAVDQTNAHLQQQQQQTQQNGKETSNKMGSRTGAFGFSTEMPPNQNDENSQGRGGVIQRFGHNRYNGPPAAWTNYSTSNTDKFGGGGSNSQSWRQSASREERFQQASHWTGSRAQQYEGGSGFHRPTDNRRWGGSGRAGQHQQREAALPEWMDDGPESVTDTIELKGFESDDDNKQRPKPNRPSPPEQLFDMKSVPEEKVQLGSTREDAPEQKAFDLNSMLDFAVGDAPPHNVSQQSAPSLPGSRFSKFFQTTAGTAPLPANNAAPLNTSAKTEKPSSSRQAEDRSGSNDWLKKLFAAQSLQQQQQQQRLPLSLGQAISVQELEQKMKKQDESQSEQVEEQQVVQEPSLQSYVQQQRAAEEQHQLLMEQLKQSQHAAVHQSRSAVPPPPPQFGQQQQHYLDQQRRQAAPTAAGPEAILKLQQQQGRSQSSMLNKQAVKGNPLQDPAQQQKLIETLMRLQQTQSGQDIGSHDASLPATAAQMQQQLLMHHHQQQQMGGRPQFRTPFPAVGTSQMLRGGSGGAAGPVPADMLANPYWQAIFQQMLQQMAATSVASGSPSPPMNPKSCAGASFVHPPQGEWFKGDFASGRSTHNSVPTDASFMPTSVLQKMAAGPDNRQQQSAGSSLAGQQQQHEMVKWQQQYLAALAAMTTPAAGSAGQQQQRPPPFMPPVPPTSQMQAAAAYQFYLNQALKSAQMQYLQANYALQGAAARGDPNAQQVLRQRFLAAQQQLSAFRLAHQQQQQQQQHLVPPAMRPPSPVVSAPNDPTPSSYESRPPAIGEHHSTILDKLLANYSATSNASALPQQIPAAAVSVEDVEKQFMAQSRRNH